MDSSRRTKQIALATASNYARQIIQILVFLLLTPLILQRLGKEDFGLWMLVQATVGLMGLMDFGLSTSVVKFVADARGRNDYARIGNVTATLFWLYVALGAFLIIAAALFAPAIPAVFHLPESYSVTAPYVFLLVAVRAGLDLPLGMFTVIFVGFQKQFLSNVLRIVGVLTYAGMAVWVLYYKPSLIALGWASLISGVAANLLGLLLCVLHLPSVKIAPRNFRRYMLREVSTFSTYVFLIQMSLLIATRLDTVLVKMFLPLTAVALYSVAMRVMDQAWILCRQLTTALTPLLAELKGAGEHEAIERVLKRGSQISVALSMPVLLGLMWLADDLLAAWLGAGFEEAVIPLQILLATAMFGVVHGNAENVLVMTGHQKYLAYSTIANQVGNFLLTVALINLFGLPGAAMATLLASAGFYFFLILPKVNREYRLNILEYYRAAIGPAIPGGAIMLLFLWLCQAFIPEPDLVQLAVFEVCACIVFFAGFYWLGLRRNGRLYYKEKLRMLAGSSVSTKRVAEQRL